MRTWHLVDPELRLFLQKFPTRSFSAETLPQARLLSRQLTEERNAHAPAFPDIEVTERFVPGPAGAPAVRVLVYLPKNRCGLLPALLWIHGGGYFLGSADGDDLKVKQQVMEVGCAAVSVDYRLAPETPFPGPVEDCYAALKWLYGHATELGVDAGRIAIGGASAGGGLAAALALLARDRAEVPVAFQLLQFPMIDDRTAVTDDAHPFTGEFIWTAAANRFGWTAYLGHEPGRPDVSAYASPARAENLAGLPPALITVGALDLFLEEDMEYARRLLRAGVPTELHVYPGAYHGFPMVADARVTQAHARDCNHALRRALFPGGTRAS